MTIFSSRHSFMVELEHYSWQRIIGLLLVRMLLHVDARFFCAIILKMQRGLTVAPVYAHLPFMSAAMTRLLFCVRLSNVRTDSKHLKAAKIEAPFLFKMCPSVYCISPTCLWSSSSIIIFYLHAHLQGHLNAFRGFLRLLCRPFTLALLCNSSEK